MKGRRRLKTVNYHEIQKNKIVVVWALKIKHLNLKTNIHAYTEQGRILMDFSKLDNRLPLQLSVIAPDLKAGLLDTTHGKQALNLRTYN